MESNIILVGFMGCGKSTIGRRVAQRLGCDFLDSDELVVAKAGKSISGIFADEGENRFREMETAELAALTVSPAAQGQGDGEKVLKRVEHRARSMGLTSIFVLTTRTMHWFIKRGFVPVEPEWLPAARQKKYNIERGSRVLVKKLV